MATQLYPEWRDENEKVHYPFIDTATLTNGVVTLSEDLFFDARLYPIGGDVRVYLNRIEIEGRDVTIAIADPVTGELASGTFDLDSPPENLSLTDTFGRPAGILVSTSDKLAALAGFGSGAQLFEVEDTEFVASVVVPTPQVGVRGILLDDGTLFTGDVFLVGERGVVLSIDDGAIRVDVIGDPFALRALCDDEGFELPPICGLKTINGITPDERGDFKLTTGSNSAFDSVLRIEQIGNRLVIKAVGQRFLVEG